MMTPKKSLQEIQLDLQSGDYSMSELVDSYLQYAKKHESLNIYIELYEEEVKKRIDQGRIIFGKTGKAGPIQRIFLKEKMTKK